jgi:glycosyltransferase involved in cell wall biosynthesis
MGRKRILWLASWYPNRYDRFNGDFIQRHAQAASIDNDIYVIHLQDADDITNTQEEQHVQDGLTERIIYYRKPAGIIGKVIKQISFFSIYKKAIKAYIKEYGLPHCVHVHVPWKVGILALWMKKKYGVLYVVTEHWGIYNNVVAGNYFTKPVYFRKLVALIIKNSVKLLTVSRFIGHNIDTLVTPKDFVFVPNAVNTNYFKYSGFKHANFTFLHVSNMVGLKNVEGILKAFRTFISQENANVQIVLVGNKDRFYEHMALELGIPARNISFMGEVPYEEVAKQMQSSHCLILNSNIENSPCVIGEALCCGIPVIATKVGGIPELVNNSNSVLIEPNSNKGLSDAMKTVYLNYSLFDGQEISRNAILKFSYEVISREFNCVYNSQ